MMRYEILSLKNGLTIYTMKRELNEYNKQKNQKQKKQQQQNQKVMRGPQKG